MLAVVLAALGVIIGCALDACWWALSVLANARPITEQDALAVVVLSVVFCVATGFALVIWDDARSGAR